MMQAPWEKRSEEASFLKSALATENRFQSGKSFLEWFESRKAANRFVVEQVALSELDQWFLAEDPQRLAHRSGKFFTVEGARVHTNFGSTPSWDQPIIRQPEIGILGIVTKVFEGVRYFLMQAKMEPGNVNTLQLSPTVQATKSNYTRVHAGKRTRYLEYFVEPGRSRVLVDQLQSEHGSYFLRKRNRNMVVEVEDDLSVHDDYRWLTLGEIERLMLIDNLVNMDSRSVISCIPLAHGSWGEHLEPLGESLPVLGHRLTGFQREVLLSMLCRHRARHSMDEVLSWITGMKSGFEIQSEAIPLSEVREWVLTERGLRHVDSHRRSVIGVAVEAGSREVSRWSQPLLRHDEIALSAFLTRRIEGVLHFLARASLNPGNVDGLDIGPTVSCSRYKHRPAEGTGPPFLDLVAGCRPEQIRYSTIQSEEGGRFYHFQNLHRIVELPADLTFDTPPETLWMTLGQLAELQRYGFLNLEARSVLSCLGLLGSG